MNQVDQFIAHRLKGRFLFWQRYVDDILFLGEDVEQLKSIVPLVQEFISRELKITLNSKKTVLQPLSRGLDHLGYFHKPDHQLVRQRVVNNCKVRIRGYQHADKTLVDPGAVCSAPFPEEGEFSVRLRPSEKPESRQIPAAFALPERHNGDLRLRSKQRSASRKKYCQKILRHR